MIDRCPITMPTTVAPLRPLPVNRVVLFFYVRWPGLFMPKRVCSWCPAVMRRGGIFSGGKISHGVCMACSKKAHAQLRDAHVWEHDRVNRPLGDLLLFFIAICLSAGGCERSEPSPARYRAIVHQAVDVSPTQLEVRP